jgi:acyl carrier protein
MTTLDRIYGVLDACFGTEGERSPDVRVSAFTENSLVLLEFVLLIEDEFDLDLDGYDGITTESTMGEIAAQLDGLMDG